jgi:phospholipase/carboxylesterase
MSDHSEERFFQELGRLGPALLAALDGLEWVQRRLHPPDLPRLQSTLQPGLGRLAEARARFIERPPPPGLEALHCDLLAAVEPAEKALALFAGVGDSFDPQAEGVARILAAMQLHCSALEALFPLRTAMPPINRYFVESPFRFDLAALDPEPPEGVVVGLQRGRDAGEGGRGGFSLYVPEAYDGTTAWPLVVALHGGGGQGRDFLWTWLREARGRRFLLLAPTSRGPTWSLQGPDDDAPALAAMVRAVSKRWKVDPERILLTGLSDGATYTLLAGLQEDVPFTALAPVSGVLHPQNFANGNLERARGKRIYMVHGVRDWMFPVRIAQVARDELDKAGAELVYRELEDLSHTYPREENDKILAWFDPGLALPEEPRQSD